MDELSPLHERLLTVVGRSTYRAVAESTGHNPETVRRYLQGQAPSVEFLADVCARYDISAQWLLTGRGVMRHSEARAHALREANPAELLAAIASALERLTERVDRIELFVQTLEAKLTAASGRSTSALRGGEADQRAQASPIRARPIAPREPAADRAGPAARIADALSQRPPADAP